MRVIKYRPCPHVCDKSFHVRKLRILCVEACFKWAGRFIARHFCLRFIRYSQIKDAASTCPSKIEFIRGYPNLYYAALHHGILDEVCGHMRPLQRKMTLGACLETARQCETISEWYRLHNGHYQAAGRRPEWKRLCTAHMKKYAPNALFAVYVITFENGFNYVGITVNVPLRLVNHLKQGTVFQYLKQNHSIAKLSIIEAELGLEDVKERERFYIASIPNVINRSSGGSVGGYHSTITFEECLTARLKHGAGWKTECPRLHRRAVKNRWLTRLATLS